MQSMWEKGYQVLSSYLTLGIISAQMHVLPHIFSKTKPPPWSLWKLLTINAIYVWERLPSPIILSYTLSLTHRSVLINRISSKNQQSLAYCQFFLRYQKIKCDGSNLDSFTWGFGWFSSFIYCRTPCCHCDTVKTSNFSQIQPNLAKIWQNRETSAYYKKISYRPKMKCK